MRFGIKRERKKEKGLSYQAHNIIGGLKVTPNHLWSLVRRQLDANGHILTLLGHLHSLVVDFYAGGLAQENLLQ